MVGLNKKSSSYEHPEIKINDNTLSFNSTAIQVSSIARIWLGEISKSPGWVMAGILLLLVSTQFREASRAPWGGIVCALLGILSLIHFFKKNKRTLNIQLNSGETYSLISKNDDFYDQAFETITECFSKKENVSMIINLGSGTIVHGGGDAIIGGNKYGGENNINIDRSNRANGNITIEAFPYETIDKEICAITELLKEKNHSEYIEFFNRLREDVKAKDSDGITAKLKNISADLLAILKEIGIQVCSPYIAKLLGLN